MRLLRLNDNGEFSFIEVVGAAIPPYAILSHIASAEEVSFAAKDGLRYFWVDTCCIDKSSSAELQEAINSHFAWCHNAICCYVYLSDVSTVAHTIASLRSSRWFTRGWTLQELIAPALVKFFSIGGEFIGDKISLLRDIHEITGVPVEALQGAPLAKFSVEERMSWAKNRQTTREEDAAYSLMGLFDVYMPVIYGEGREHALRRLEKEIQASSNHTTFSPAPGYYIASDGRQYPLSQQPHPDTWTHIVTPRLTRNTSTGARMSAAIDLDSDDGSEIDSVFSDSASSVSSASTASLNPVQTVGIREVSRALLSEEELKATYILAISSVDSRKARLHIRGFLRDYGRDLLKEASDSSLEIQAAKFVRELAGRIADEIIWSITGSAELPHPPDSEVKKQDLETWLSTIRGDSIVEERNQPSLGADGDDSSDEELNDDLPFPHIDRVKEFLINSEAFRVLVLAMQAWLKIDGVDQKNIGESITDTPKPTDSVVVAEETKVETIASVEDQEQTESSNEAPPMVIEIHQNQDAAQEQAPRTRSRRRGGSFRDLVSSLLNFWGISFYLYDIVELFVPHVPRGYRRLRWRCSCNTILWGDFLDEDAAAFDQLKQQLSCMRDPLIRHVHMSGISTTQATGVSGSGATGSAPSTQTSSLGPPSGLTNTPRAGNAHNIVSSTASGPDYVVEITSPIKYFEVCVSTGNHAIDHHEVDISRISSDNELFEMIWDKYNISRGIGLRRLFLRPSDVNFVMFSVSQRNQYGAGIHKKPDEFPPQEELDEKRYHYLCPRIRMPVNVFLHYLHRARWNIWGEHMENIWLQRLPKKLERNLIAEAQQAKGNAPPNEDLAFGWGVHIIEGPNHAVLGLLLAIGVAVAFIVSGMIVGFAKTQEQGFGVGNFLLAILASTMTAVYFQLQD
ncbi:hypothetical protein GT037_006274 [Alternaria burnsii]|uniref:Heterokaryon incompatibility domain-containing protein n=1 Tax=Alternaria burnsii TaxID=1187904 RepID=A0A8H7EEF1_9PLEO|nr:uncharacterized protein GT037_006274 [Alternaria burnsii]KAF7675555.1 hypothetical protein GT037_006274 [Alternaria burnsii]